MNALVLSRRAYREYDQIITLYTKERGLLKLVAKGVKKIKSKNNSALEPFSYIDVGIASGKEYDYITSVTIERYFSALRADLHTMLVASFICTTLTGILGEEEPDPALYDFLLASFTRWEESASLSLGMIDEFFLLLAAHLGFVPILETSSGECVYSFVDGACIAPLGGSRIEGPTMSLSQTIREALQSNSLLALSEHDAGLAHRFVLQFVRFSLERGIPDWGTLEERLGKRG